MLKSMLWVQTPILKNADVTNDKPILHQHLGIGTPLCCIQHDSLQVNVLGFMHFWGLTIDVVSSIIVIISIGLCVDYSAHIASTFLSSKGNESYPWDGFMKRCLPSALSQHQKADFKIYIYVLRHTFSKKMYCTMYKISKNTQRIRICN